MDSSTSIAGKDFKKSLQFLQKLVDEFIISAGNVRTGLVQFSGEARLRWPLTEYTDAKSLKNAKAGVPKINGKYCSF